MNLAVLVSQEAATDRETIYRLIVAAFDGRTEEADMVDGLRESGDVVVSLVARYHGEIVGNAVFSRVFVDDPAGPAGAVALAPVAVAPSLQNRGVGFALIQQGIRTLRTREETVALVVGNPDYYTRFGFSVEAAKRYPSVYSGPYYMALILGDGSAAPAGGVTYPDAFELVN